jgi:hypothetical protein
VELETLCFEDPLRRCFTFLDSVLLDLYPACAEELYSDVVIKLCNYSFIPVLYGFVPLEIGIARDSLFLGLSRKCRESGFRSRKFGSFHSGPHMSVGRGENPFLQHRSRPVAASLVPMLPRLLPSKPAAAAPPAGIEWAPPFPISPANTQQQSPFPCISGRGIQSSSGATLYGRLV